MKKKCLALLLLAALLLGGCNRGDTQLQTDVTTTPTQSETVDDSQSTGGDETQPTDFQAAPDFTLYTLDGTPIKLSDFEGKPTVLNFWASWCGPCKMEMPDLEEAYLEYGDEINFLIVNLTDGRSETVETAHAYIESQGYTFPVYYDTDMGGAYTYGVSAIPVTFFIDADGNILAYYQGAMTAEILQQGISMIYLLEK